MQDAPSWRVAGDGVIMYVDISITSTIRCACEKGYEHCTAKCARYTVTPLEKEDTVLRGEKPE
jgi:hypothetical protein